MCLKIRSLYAGRARGVPVTVLMQGGCPCASWRGGSPSPREGVRVSTVGSPSSPPPCDKGSGAGRSTAPTELGLHAGPCLLLMADLPSALHPSVL